jgi:hypothetical protein
MTLSLNAASRLGRMRPVNPAFAKRPPGRRVNPQLPITSYMILIGHGSPLPAEIVRSKKRAEEYDTIGQ